MSGCPGFKRRLQHGAFGLGFAGADGPGLGSRTVAEHFKLFVNVARILTDASLVLSSALMLRVVRLLSRR